MKELYYINPITNEDSLLKIEDIVINKMTIRFLKTDIKNNNEIIEIVNKLFKDLDCSVILNCGKLTSVNTPKYYKILSELVYYIEKLDNDENKNFIYEKLIKLHIDNIKFDYNYFKNNPVIKETKKIKTKSTKKKTLWIKQETKDMFDNNKIIYIYTNTKTGEIIRDENPNLLEKLNIKHKKEKQIKKTYHIGDVYLKFK